MGRYPFFYLLIPLIAGIMIAQAVYCPLFCLYTLAGIALSLCVIYLFHRKAIYLYLSICAALFASGWHLSSRAWQATALPFQGDNQEQTYILQLQDYPIINEKTIRVNARNASSQIVLTLPKDSVSQSLTQGDIILARGAIRQPQPLYEGAFDYGRYLRLQGKSGTLYTYEWQFVEHKPIHSLRAWAQTCQYKLMQYYRQHGLEDSNLGILAALTLGDRSALDPETEQQFSASGAMHILAVSGLHVGVIYLIIYYLLTVFGLYPPKETERTRRLVQTILIILSLWIYAFVTGLSPSVLRAALMLSLFTLGRYLYRANYSFNTIFASAFLILLVHPLDLYNVSFQLSFAAVLSIVYFTPRFTAWWKVKNRVLRYFWQLFCMSLAAQIGTIPITLYYFSQTCNYFALTNFVVIPAASIIIYTAIIFFLLAPIGCGIIGKVLFGEIWALNKYTQLIENLPLANTRIHINLLTTLLFIALIIALGYAVRKFSWQRISAVCIILIALIGSVIWQTKENEQRHETMLVSVANTDILCLTDHHQSLVLSNDTSAARVRLQDYFTTAQAQQVRYVQLDSIAMFSLDNQTFIYLNDSVLNHKIANAPIATDYLLLGDIGRVSPQYILPLFEANEVILLSTMRAYKRRQLIEYLQDTQIPYTDLSYNSKLLKQ